MNMLILKNIQSIDLIRMAADDIRRHRESGANPNPYSTHHAKDSWQRGFEAQPELLLTIEHAYKRGQIAAKLIQTSNLNPLLVTLSQAPDRHWGIADPRKISDIAVVDNLAQASEAVQAYVGKHGLGGGTWTGGAVCNLNDQVVARVSYNGRVWTPEGTEIPIPGNRAQNDSCSLDEEAEEFASSIPQMA